MYIYIYTYVCIHLYVYIIHIYILVCTYNIQVHRIYANMYVYTFYIDNML